MKRSARIAKILSSALFVSAVIIACRKEDSTALSPAQEQEAASYSTEAETEAEVVFNDVFDNVMGVNAEVGIGGTGIFGRMSSVVEGREMDVDSVPGCTQVSINFLAAPARFPVRIAIDFGSGCIGRDGRLRAGRIITEYSGRLIEPGSSATTVFEGFKFDSISIEGKYKITNTTAAGSNQRQFTIDISDATLTRPNGDYLLWTSHRVITQIEGNGTPMIPRDDIFRVTGSGHGRVKHEDLMYAWQSEIVEPLIKKFTCHWISKGTIDVKRESQSGGAQWAAVLDYGQGDCDHVATLTINGVSHQIQLPH